MKGAHSEQTRVHSDGKWTMTCLLVSAIVVVVMLYVNFWVMLPVVGCFWLVTLAWRGAAKKLIHDEVAKPVEQTHTPIPLLKPLPVGKGSGRPKRQKREAKTTLDSTKMRDTHDSHPEMSASNLKSPPASDVVELSQRLEDQHCADTNEDTVAAFLGPTEADKTVSAQERWIRSRSASPARNASPVQSCEDAILPARSPSTERSSATVKRAGSENAAGTSTSAARRGELEREILKLEKKARAVKKLLDRQTNGELLEQNQLEKIARGIEVQARIETMRIQVAVVQYLNTMSADNRAEPQSSEHHSEMIEAPPGLLPFGGELAAGGIEEPAPPPGLVVDELEPPPGLTVDGPSPGSVVIELEPSHGLVVELPPPGFVVDELEPPPGLVVDEPAPACIIEESCRGVFAEEPPSGGDSPRTLPLGCPCSSPPDALPEEQGWEETWEPSSIGEAWESVSGCNAAYWGWAAAAGYHAPCDASTFLWEPLYPQAWDYSMEPYAFAPHRFPFQTQKRLLKTRANRGAQQSFIDPRELLKRSPFPKESMETETDLEIG
jgi:hypothetical protein